MMLCSGNTCEYIAAAIKDKLNLRVVTNDINILLSIASNKNNGTINVILPGGEVDLGSLQLSGSVTESMLEGMYFDYSFIEVDGVSIERGYSVDDFSKASIIKKVMGLSKEVIAVCAQESFENQAFYHIGQITTFEKVISTEHTPEEFKTFYYNSNIQLLTTFDVY